MSDARLLSDLKGMRQRFWHERRGLQEDEIRLQWAAEAAQYTNILLGTEAQTLPLELTSNQGQQMARQSTSMSWAEAAARKHGSVRTYLHLLLSRREGADAGIEYRHSYPSRATKK